MVQSTSDVVELRLLKEKSTLKQKTTGVTKCMNMDFQVVGTSNQLFKGGSYNETKFSKN